MAADPGPEKQPEVKAGRKAFSGAGRKALQPVGFVCGYSRMRVTARR